MTAAAGGSEAIGRKRLQKLVKALISGNISEIRPFVDPARGVTYPEVEEILDAPPSEVRNILESLADDGILIRELDRTLVSCPSCPSSTFAIELRCPICNSPRLEKGIVIEHMSCGHIDFEHKFLRGGALVCPKCNKQLRAIGIDYRKPINYYKCLSCGNFSSIVARSLLCYKCGRIISEGEESIFTIASYRFNPERRAALEAEFIDLQKIAEKLQALGWVVDVMSSFKGVSGIEHTFSMIISTPDYSFTAALDFVIDDNPIDEVRILSLSAIKLDTRLNELFLVAVPGLNEQAKRLASFYKIHVIESPTTEGLVELTFNKIKEKLGVVRAERVHVCPKCSSQRLDLVESCTKCGSEKLLYNSLNEYHVCIECGSRNKSPTILAYCRECKSKFSLDETRSIIVYKHVAEKSGG